MNTLYIIRFQPKTTHCWKRPISDDVKEFCIKIHYGSCSCIVCLPPINWCYTILLQSKILTNKRLRQKIYAYSPTIEKDINNQLLRETWERTQFTKEHGCEKKNAITSLHIRMGPKVESDCSFSKPIK